LLDLRRTADSAADFLGLIFTSESKRFVSPWDAVRWLDQVALKPSQQIVGLFVNESPDTVGKIAETVPLDLIQCHGSEMPEEVERVSGLTGLPVWKVVHHDDQSLETMRSFAGIAAGYVIDCKVKGKWGGTGNSFDWHAVPEYMAEAERQGVKCLTAGGIRPENVVELLEYRPHGIDLSSGIEENGGKSERKIRCLEERMKAYERSLS
jgi:phosphoribosylanthranilate isomerase